MNPLFRRSPTPCHDLEFPPTIQLPLKLLSTPILLPLPTELPLLTNNLFLHPRFTVYLLPPGPVHSRALGFIGKPLHAGNV